MAATPRFPPESSRTIVEEYVLRLAPQLGDDFAFVVLLPWTCGQKPANVLAPEQGREADLSSEALVEVVSQYSTLLVPCTYETQHEQQVATRLLEQLEVYDELCVFMLQLLSRPNDRSQEYMQIIMNRHDALLAIGTNGVLLDPEDDPELLRMRVDQEKATFEANAERVNLLFAVNDESAQKIREQHHRLVWESIPKALMPHFAPLDHNLYEAMNQIGHFQLLQRFKTRQGSVILAKDLNKEHDDKVVVKLFDKTEVLTPSEVECIYREFRFLMDILQHQHIARCYSMLHSPSRVYFILQFGGMQNFSQLLQAQPGYRLDPDEALDCTLQIAGALAYCHGQDVVHRQVCLEHMVVEDQADRFHCRLVDFQSAIYIRSNQVSNTLCGDLPCMAPEMAAAAEEPYVPWPVDCWSLGIVLLEAAGGVGSLKHVVRWDDEMELQDVASMIREFFSEEGSQARALAGMGGVQDGDVLEKLQAVLKIDPLQRTKMADVISL